MSGDVARRIIALEQRVEDLEEHCVFLQGLVRRVAALEAPPAMSDDLRPRYFNEPASDEATATRKRPAKAEKPGG